MKMKILVGILAVLILINLAAIGSFLYHTWDKPDRRGFEPRGKMEQELSKESRQKMRELHKKFRTETRDIEKTLRQEEKELLELMTNENFNEEVIKDKANNISSLRNQLSNKMIDQLLEAKTFLTPDEQRRFFNAMLRTRPGPQRGNKGGRDMAPPPKRGNF